MAGTTLLCNSLPSDTEKQIIIALAYQTKNMIISILLLSLLWWVKPLCDGCKTHWQRNANRLRGLFQRLENNKTFVPGPDALKKIFGIKLPLQHSFSPGLVVMWGDSCSEGCEFKSQHHILDGHFSHLFLVRIVMFVWKDKNKQKRGLGWPIVCKKGYDLDNPSVYNHDQLIIPYWSAHVSLYLD